MKINLLEDGFIVIYKPKNISSFDVIRHIKKLVKCNKIGHMGTLDPFASGVLPIAINNATKLFNYCLSDYKTYIADIIIGEKRDSGDVTGVKIAESDAHLTLEELTLSCNGFLGEIWQRPHKFSATKINGERAYVKARNNEDFELEPKRRFIKQIQILNFDENKRSAKILIECSSGTYIRSLMEDILENCNNYAYVESLERTKSCNFSLQDTITLDNLENLLHNNVITLLSPLERALDDILGIEFNDEEMLNIKNGKQIKINNLPDGLYKSLNKGKLFAIGHVNQGIFKVKRVII